MKYPVTLIITHYNQKEFLDNLLKYITSSNFLGASEVIIIDDASLKRKEFDNMKLKYLDFIFIQNQENRGPSYSRNLGASKAKFEYLQFLDADDWISPEKIQVQYNVAKLNNMPSFIASTWCRVTATSKIESPEIINTFEINLEKETVLTIMMNFIQIMTGLINRNDFLMIKGFKEDMRIIEDINFLIRLFSLKENFISFETNNPTSFYRENISGSLSQSNNQEYIRNIFFNYLTAYKHIRINKNEINMLKLQTLDVLWNCYLGAINNNDDILLNKVIAELQTIQNLGDSKIKGKKFLICRLINFKNASKIFKILK